jgi:hypothetical protein
MHLRLRTVLFGIVVLSAFGATPLRAVTDTNPDGSINVGSATLFTALSRGDMNSYDNNITGPSLVVGNVGVGGHGNFSMSDGQIQGDFYMNDYGTFSMSGPATITGHKRGLHLDGISQQTTLDHANSDMMNLSDMAATESSSPNSAYTVNGSHTGLTNVNTGQSMTVADSSPFGSKIVLNLQNFVMTSGTFTLQGTAMTTYIINVKNNFSLNNSKVVLSGGLLASHVLFNITGTGSQVSLNQGTSLQGVLVAYQRKLDLSGGKIFGRAMANQVVITSGGQVVSQ